MGLFGKGKTIKEGLGLNDDRSVYEELALKPRPKPEDYEKPVKPKPIIVSDDLSRELEIINSKLDMIKVQLDSLNNALMNLSVRIK